MQGDRPSRNGHEGVTSVEKGQSKTTGLLTGRPGLGENEASSRIVEKREAKSIEIDGEVKTRSIAFVADGDYIVSSDNNKIRRWRVKDGKEVGQQMDAGSKVWSIAASRDGKWIVSGAYDGRVTVWDAENHKEAIEFRGHSGFVSVMDISPDGTRIATGSWDYTLCVWSLSTGKQLLGPIKHDYRVVAAKFSPDGRRIATATWTTPVRVYDSHDGRLLVDTPIRVGSSYNHSLAWTALSKELLTLSDDGTIHRIDVATGTTLSKWAIHRNYHARCIALASDGAFIAASAKSSVSFWEIATHQQIGPLIHHPYKVESMAISANHSLVMSGGKKIILRKLPDILPSSCFDHVHVLSPKVDDKETLFTMNCSQRQPEAVRTSTKEGRPEETIGSHRTKHRCSSESSQQEVPVQPLAVNELPPPKTDEKERLADIDNIQSNFPHDLSGHVIKSSGFPIASGSYGDIYKGTLNARGGTTEVHHCLPSREETKQRLGCDQDMQDVLAAR